MSDKDVVVDDDVIQALKMQLTTTPKDPASATPYPPNLPLELALETATLEDLLETYELTPKQAKKIFSNPAFRKEYELNCEAVKTEGFSFKKRAQAQAEQYLGLAWSMAHDPHTPAPVRADLIKNTIKWAALDSPIPASQGNQNFITPETLAQLQAMPDSELEIQVMKIVSRRAPAKQVETNLIEGETE